MIQTITHHRYLLQEFILRDIRSRYVGSLAGILWSVITPLVLLAVYTFVAHVFSWRMQGAGSGSTWLTAASIFAGLLPWIAFQESVNRSAVTFIENANMIRKQRFPLEALPLKTVAAAIIHQLVASAV
ncbi:MAG: ABC transporter permease, partial [Acidobacteriota bacterium]